MRTHINVAITEPGPFKSAPQQVKRNTFVYTTEDGVTHYQLHHTVIAKRYPNGRIELNAGEWLTETTFDRLNLVLEGTGYAIERKGFTWMVHREGHCPMPFRNGMVIVL